jgi:asparagine synthase (glutamine-hydrolysing)
MARALRVVGYPDVVPNALGYIPFFEESRRRGITTLFSGFGGDQAVSAQASRLRRELLDQHRYVAYWSVLEGGAPRRAARTVKAAFVGRRLPSCNEARLRTLRSWWSDQLLRPEVVERLDLHHEFVGRARRNAPLRRVNDLVLARLQQVPYTSRQLEHCTLIAASYGVQYRWPLLDARLVQQYLSTPSIEKMGPGGLGRYLHRRAVDGLVPDCITWRRGKDVGPPLPHRQVWAREDLARTLETARRIEPKLHPAIADVVDCERLREQIARAAHASPDSAFAFTFRGNVKSLAWLQVWLEGEAAG